MINFELPDGFFFFDGIEISNENYIFAMLDKRKVEEGVEETYFITKSGSDWDYLGEVPWAIAAMCKGTGSEVIAFSSDGDVALVDPAGCTGSSVPVNFEGPYSIRASVNLDGSVYVSGYGGAVFCIDSTGNWIDLSPPHCDGWFESVSGDSGTLSVVGLHGDVWVYNGTWSKVDYPSNANLHDVCVCTSGEIFVCGSDGHLGLGRGEQWKVIETDLLVDDLWKIFECQGKVFISSMYSLYEYRDGEVVLSDLMAKSHVGTFYNCSCSENGILIVDEALVSRCGLDECKKIYS